jgi:SAM-dependent methyltransferase
MPEELLVETLGRVRAHPWWAARAILAVDVLKAEGVKPPAPVVEVGCGWGTNLQALEKAGYQSVGIDVSPRILKILDRPERQLIEADLNQPLPSRHKQYEGILLLDVIEHLDDDRAALQRVAELASPKGVVVVSVPALPELFSEYDRIQGHRRRYVPETLRTAFEGTNLEVKKIFWWGSWMVPVLRRMRSKVPKPSSAPKTYADYLRLPPWPAPLLMKWLYAREKGPALRGELQAGTSLFAVAIRSG